MIALLLLVLALLLAFALGDYHGRTRQERFYASGVVKPGMAAFEASLRRSKGLRRLHPDPENAMRIHKARIIR
jgi:hypothetical protein